MARQYLKAHPECEFGADKFVAAEVLDPTEYDRLYGLAERVVMRATRTIALPRHRWVDQFQSSASSRARSFGRLNPCS